MTGSTEHDFQVFEEDDGDWPICVKCLACLCCTPNAKNTECPGEPEYLEEPEYVEPVEGTDD